MNKDNPHVSLYLLNTALLSTHEIDSAFWKEWELFGLPGGIQVFLVLNLLLLLAVLYGFGQLLRGARSGQMFALLRLRLRDSRLFYSDRASGIYAPGFDGTAGCDSGSLADPGSPGAQSTAHQGIAGHRKSTEREPCREKVSDLFLAARRIGPLDGK